MYQDLEQLVLAFAESNISLETGLMQYSYQFRPIAVYLTKMRNYPYMKMTCNSSMACQAIHAKQ